MDFSDRANEAELTRSTKDKVSLKTPSFGLNANLKTQG
jgi:hypothetical protein